MNLSKGGKITAILLSVIILSLLAYDIFAATYWGADATISWVSNSLAHKYPIFALLVGIVIGHIFASMMGITSAILQKERREGDRDKSRDIV